ncbi:N-methyl-L-tryptophan oxidase [Deinococcus cellulosilyticus]|uniref:N-methyltryptophan oxidase n=1 Tax=Deinococcus cellulosilyticus (strain DSM 18568 / NBRC 106333 / KACC 11606 / 5516J-15) TaxID=1223518 RepID=A0A511N030_DEIC1|nr:N-methyl-L-tryptophan oxidase [Deinococcus cellulosilyticus]GEM45848.1 N-methyltryptophan oxidase [Deinococcus cellulosilyticus NBRC 106333 = KACC 11606]
MTQILIIGAGLNGLSCAYAAWKQGHQVTVIEQFSLGHTLGSSHGESRIIRYSYDSPEYVRLAKRAYALWQELEDHLGMQVLHLGGGIDIAPAEHPLLKKHMAALDAEQIPHELLSAAAAMERFPQFHIPENEAVLYQKDAGILKPDDLLPALAGFLREQGVSIQENTPVLEIDHGKVVTERWTYTPDQVLVCAGAWMNALLPSPLPLQATQEQVSYHAAPDSRFHFPAMPVVIDLVRGPYGFPQLGKPGVKFGLHHQGPEVTPQTRTFEPNPALLQKMGHWLETFMPEVSPEPSEVVTCLYTSTPDENFVIDRVTPKTTVVSACSGHGFKFGPATGELALQRAFQESNAFPEFFLADFQQE